MKWFWEKKECKNCKFLEHQLTTQIARKDESLSIWKEMYINQYTAARGHMKGIERLRRKIKKLEGLQNEQ